MSGQAPRCPDTECLLPARTPKFSAVGGVMHRPMNWIDTCVLGTYLSGITLYGIRVGFGRNASSKHYFLANKSLGWFTVGAAVK